jgi:hypothetical protein
MTTTIIAQGICQARPQWVSLDARPLIYQDPQAPPGYVWEYTTFHAELSDDELIHSCVEHLDRVFAAPLRPGRQLLHQFWVMNTAIGRGVATFWVPAIDVIPAVRHVIVNNRHGSVRS